MDFYLERTDYVQHSNNEAYHLNRT